MFLGSETEEIIGELKYEGAGAGGNFKLEKQVFLIGSQHGEAGCMQELQKRKGIII